jgi:hypothetical protein
MGAVDDELPAHDVRELRSPGIVHIRVPAVEGQCQLPVLRRWCRSRGARGLDREGEAHGAPRGRVPRVGDAHQLEGVRRESDLLN